MAGEDRTATDALEFLQALEREPYRYQFYEAVRRLECLHRDEPRFGKALRLADDPVRLSQEPSLAFAPASLASFDPGGEDRRSRLAVLLFGLFGPNGPLPLHLTEYARGRMRNASDSTFARFVDLFHHRLLCLFYRAWADGQPTVSFDRPDRDRFAYWVGSLFGLGMPSLRDRDAMPDLARLHYAGLLSSQTRNASGLRAMLEDFFDLPVEVESFVGRWVELPEKFRLRLGDSPETGSLGRTATIGVRIWDRQQKFRLVVGPLRLVDYERLLPGGKSLERLVSVVRSYAGDEWIWDANLVLHREEVPPLKLGGPARLGLTTWLSGEKLDRDVADLFLNPMAELPVPPRARQPVGESHD
jgi:type VI secretion system protein ImpH